MVKRLIAAVLALIMALSVFAVSAVAEDEPAVPVSTAHFITQTAGDGETLYVPEGGEMFISFELDPCDDMVCGWRTDLFGQTGFEIDLDPTIDEEDGTVYAHIMTADKKVGDKATLYYSWYKSSDIWGPEAVGWIDAVPVYSCTVIIEVAADPQTFAFVLDDDTRFFEGDTIQLERGSELLLSCDLTYYDDWWLPYTDLSDLTDKGFTVDDEIISFEDAGFKYRRISCDDVEPGTVGTVNFKWYAFEDYFSGDLSDKESAYPSYVNIEVVEPEEEEEVNILGDADGDKIVTIIDATVIQRFLAGYEVKSFCKLTADANRNGTVEITDATAIQRDLADFNDYENIGESVTYGTYYASWNIFEDILPEGCTLAGAEAEAARAEIRNALSLLVDRNDDIFTGRGNLAANSFIPKWISDADGSEFHAKAGGSNGYFDVSADAYAANVESAVATLKKYYAYDSESGKFTNFPALTYIYNDSPMHQAIGAQVQSAFASVGIEMTLEAKDWGSYTETLDNKEYSLARSGWVVDYDDPMEFLTMWTSENEENSVGFGRGDHADAEAYSLDLTPFGIELKVTNGTWAQTYDVLIDAINNCDSDPDRYDMMHLAEDMLMATGCILPLYYY